MSVEPTARSLPGYDVLHEDAGLVDRADRGVLRLTGADRLTFLQGLLTNDVAPLTPGTGCYAALLTPNGRMIADMRVIETERATWLDVAASIAPALGTRLDQSIFTEDARVTDATAELAEIGIYGPGASAVLARAVGDGASGPELAALPEFASRALTIAGVEVTVIRSTEIGVDGFDCLVPRASSSAVSQVLREAGAVDVASGAADTTRVEAGRPLFTVDMDEETIPLEAGLESRAISFTKGCYVGQEIIIRVMHRGGGRVARRLVGLTFDAGAPVPAHGTGVDANGRAIGRVTSAVFSPALGRPITLATLHRDFTEPGTPVSVAGAAATVHGLPFVPARLPPEGGSHGEMSR